MMMMTEISTQKRMLFYSVAHWISRDRVKRTNIDVRLINIVTSTVFYCDHIQGKSNETTESNLIMFISVDVGIQHQPNCRSLSLLNAHFLGHTRSPNGISFFLLETRKELYCISFHFLRIFKRLAI